MRVSSALFTSIFCIVWVELNAFAPQNPLSRPQTSLNMASALIVQNKGGGHGELGYQIAKELQNSYEDKIDSITILQDDACDDSTEPFRSYPTDLPDVSIIRAPLGEAFVDETMLQAVVGDFETKFDYVFDNASKKPEGAGKALVDCAKKWGVKLYTYVSSAGMYTPPVNGPFPMPETTAVKGSSGQYQFENYAKEQGLPFVSFRPQYIYGPKANKYDYIDYYFDRLVRGLPIPIPGDGTQKVSLTCSEDVASLVCSPLNNEGAATEQCIFNCGTDELVSYNDVAAMCAEVAGVTDYQIEHFDDKALGTKGNFPFRPTNFYVAPDMAKAKLGWSGPKHALKDALVWYYEGYQARGGAKKKMSLVKDWEIVVGSKTSPPEWVSTVYDDFDPLVLELPERA